MSPPDENYQLSQPDHSSVGGVQSDVVVYEAEKDSESPPRRQEGAEEQEKQKAQALASRAEREIYIARSVFPFTLFTDELVIDELKVTIVRRPFLGSEELLTSTLARISSVTVEANPLFATMRIINKDDADHPLELRYLWRSDALRARRIIQGLAIMKEQNIDTSKLNADEIRRRAEEIGRTRD